MFIFYLEIFLTTHKLTHIEELSVSNKKEQIMFIYVGKNKSAFVISYNMIYLL